MTKIINQLYSVEKKIPLKIRIYRFISKILIKILFPFEKSWFRNSFVQYLNSYISLSVNDVNLKFKDGHERLNLHIGAQYVIEKDLINWIDTFSKDDVFFDIGSNVGLFSIYAAKKGIQTVSFEGHYGNLHDFSYNILLNDVEEKILIIPVLLAEKNEKMSFFLRDLSPSSARSEINHNKNIYKLNNKEALKINTATFSLDYLIENKIIPIPSKVKIDVDGAEFLVLKGFNKYVEKVNEIIIEMYEKPANYWKCFKDYKSKKTIYTRNNNKNYFDDTVIKKNVYFDEIIIFLKNNSFTVMQKFGNNIIFKKI